MKFNYVNQNNKIVKQSVDVGMKWKDIKISNNLLNSIFQNVDNGDGVVSQTELDLINRVLEEYDENKNKVYDNAELQKAIDRYSYSWADLRKKVAVGEKIYDDIHATNWMGMPTTGDDIGKHIKMIDKKNVMTVMQIYSDKTKGKESLFSGIMGEVGLSYATRASYCKYIMNQIVSRYKEEGIYTDDIVKEFNNELKYQGETWSKANADKLDAIVKKLMSRHNDLGYNNNDMPNGKIDKDFKQGNTGDCWLVAGIKAISNSPKGKKILENSIKVAPNGDVTVTLKGPKKTYKFTRADIVGNSQLSSGDLDVRAIEMAVDKYIAEQRKSKKVNEANDLEGNSAVLAYQILTGKGENPYEWNHWYPRSSRLAEWLNGPMQPLYKITPQQVKKLNNKDHVVCVSSHIDEINKNRDTQVSRPKDSVLLQNHAYAVVRADANYVYLADLNGFLENTGEKEIKVDIKTFTSFFTNIYELDL